jgi:hypothetical protein
MIKNKNMGYYIKGAIVLIIIMLLGLVIYAWTYNNRSFVKNIEPAQGKGILAGLLRPYLDSVRNHCYTADIVLYPGSDEKNSIESSELEYIKVKDTVFQRLGPNFAFKLGNHYYSIDTLNKYVIFSNPDNAFSINGFDQLTNDTDSVYSNAAYQLIEIENNRKLLIEFVSHPMLTGMECLYNSLSGDLHQIKLKWHPGIIEHEFIKSSFTTEMKISSRTELSIKNPVFKQIVNRLASNQMELYSAEGYKIVQ